MRLRLLDFFRAHVAGDQLTHLLATKAAGDILVKGAGLVAVLIMNAVLARLLGVEAFGHYAVVIAWVTVLALLARLGMDSGILRSVAAYNARQEYGLLAGVLRWMPGVVALTGVAVAAMTAVAVWLLQDRMSPALSAAFLWGAALIPLLALAQIFQFALLGFRWIVVGQFSDLIVRPVLVATGAVALFAFYGQPAGSDAVAITLAASTLLTVVGWRLVRLATPPQTQTAQPIFRSGEWLRSSPPLLAVSGATLLLSKTDIILLGLLVSTDQAGIYAIASLLAAMAASALTALSSIAAPLISQFHSTGDRATLRRMTSVVTRWIAVTTIPIAALLIVLGPFILSIFGDDFGPAYVPLVILVGGHVIAACCGPVSLLLTMTNHERTAARISIYCASGNIVLNIVLIPLFGLGGAAIATATLTALRSILMLAAVVRLVGMNPIKIPSLNAEKK